MRAPHRLLKQIAKLGFLLMMGVSMSADAGLLGFGGNSWKEEVLLHDGQRIIAERSQSYGGRSEPGQSGPIKEHTISFTLPSSNRPITWTSEYSEDVGRTNFNLLAVHALNGTPYIVASPNLCLSYNKWGRPNPSYVVFKHDGSQWQRIAIESLPIEFKTINVVLSIQKVQAEELSAAGLTSAETISQANRRSEIPEFRSILREKINYDPECIPMVSNGKGRWRATAWFETKTNFDSCRSACRQDGYDEQHCPCNSIFQRK